MEPIKPVKRLTLDMKNSSRGKIANGSAVVSFIKNQNYFISLFFYLRSLKMKKHRV